MELDVKYSTLIKATDSTLLSLVNKEQCGWLDGGCMTLASVVNYLFPSSSFYHISRSKSLVDHVVIYFPELSLYFDADGFQCEHELFEKMRVKELVNATILEEMKESHFEQIEIFTDIEAEFLKHYQTYLNQNKINKQQ